MTIKKERTAPSDYAAIRKEHEGLYGTAVGEYGHLLFDEAYADPTHFLLELLQNAEDALSRRPDPPPAPERGVRFDLTDDALRVSHFGDPFTPEDVRNICAIGKSTKALDNIGKFGLGFKSVYRYTDRPEIHSGPEDFAICSYVWPEAVKSIDREAHETVIVIPKKQHAATADWNQLIGGFRRMLRTDNLLFLHHVESVSWSAPDGSRIAYRRTSQRLADEDGLAPAVRLVTIQSESSTKRWIVFARPLSGEHDSPTRHVEIAFRINDSDEETANGYSVRSISRSYLYAYFPTDKETHLGFLLQGPYNTTPARDNVMELDDWNEQLISETATLLRSALGWCRDNVGISPDLMNCLPLRAHQFTGGMFEPLFQATTTALQTDRLLPTDTGSHAAASKLRLGRSEDLRSLFGRAELSALYASSTPLEWVDGRITERRQPALYEYLHKHLGIEELDPESMVRRLTPLFLTHRSDAWVQQLYEFLDGHPGQTLRRLLRSRPILRLSDGEHVAPPQEDDPGVFWPVDGAAGLRTIHPAVCGSEKARRFLASVGVREPDFVHHVIEHVLPKYTGDSSRKITPTEYRADLDAILRAYATDSRQARDDLVSQLSQTQWIQAVDGHGPPAGRLFPEELYLPTPTLLGLFQGIRDVYFLDRAALPSALLGATDLLEACGVAGTLRIRQIELSAEKRSRIRARLLEDEQVKDCWGHDFVVDGLSEAIQRLEIEATDARTQRSKTLWRALCAAWKQRGNTDWTGEVRWRFGRAEGGPRRFVSILVGLLRKKRWVAADGGTLRRPSEVVFSSLGWEDEPSLCKHLQFVSDEEKSTQDGKEMLAMLRDRYDITTVAQLSSRLDAQPSDERVQSSKVSLSDIVKWWNQIKMEERRKYSSEANPAILNIPALASGGADRVGWFTLFALACFRSYGRTTEGQHKGFVEVGVREGWWRSLAESRPPKDVQVWLDRLRAWTAADQTGEQYGMWRGSFVALYTVARYLDGYIHLMLNLPRIVAEAPRPPSLSEVFQPTYSASVRKLGVDAAPLARILGIGANWMIRELLRYGVYERRGVMVPYAWMSSQQVRDLLERAGGPSLTEPDPDHSRQIHEFVVSQIGAEAAEFDGDYDLALHRWSRRGQQ